MHPVIVSVQKEKSQIHDLNHSPKTGRKAEWKWTLVYLPIPWSFCWNDTPCSIFSASNYLSLRCLMWVEPRSSARAASTLNTKPSPAWWQSCSRILGVTNNHSSHTSRPRFVPHRKCLWAAWFSACSSVISRPCATHRWSRMMPLDTGCIF